MNEQVNILEQINITDPNTAQRLHELERCADRIANSSKPIQEDFVEFHYSTLELLAVLFKRIEELSSQEKKK